MYEPFETDPSCTFRGLPLSHLSDDDLLAALRTEQRLMRLLSAKHAELAAELARREPGRGSDEADGCL